MLTAMLTVCHPRAWGRPTMASLVTASALRPMSHSFLLNPTIHCFLNSVLPMELKTWFRNILKRRYIRNITVNIFTIILLLKFLYSEISPLPNIISNFLVYVLKHFKNLHMGQINLKTTLLFFFFGVS